MCAYLTSTTKVKTRYKLRENTVQPHKMAQNYQCQIMKTQKNSIEELKRIKLGVNTPQSNKFTQGTKGKPRKSKKAKESMGGKTAKTKRATGKLKGSYNIPKFVDITDETAAKSVGQQADTKVTFPTAEISKKSVAELKQWKVGVKALQSNPLT